MTVRDELEKCAVVLDNAGPAELNAAVIALILRKAIAEIDRLRREIAILDPNHPEVQK